MVDLLQSDSYNLTLFIDQWLQSFIDGNKAGMGLYNATYEYKRDKLWSESLKHHKEIISLKLESLPRTDPQVAVYEAELVDMDAELASLEEIILEDVYNLNMAKTGKVGLILGMIVVAGALGASFFYINKNKNKLDDDYDEGGERDDKFWRTV